MSISALTSEDLFSVQFSTNCCIIQEKSTLRTIGKGNLKEGLYILQNDYSRTDLQPLLEVITVVSHTSTSLWHSRLGHPSFDRLTALKDFLSIDSTCADFVLPCEICPLAKQKRLSFVSHNNRSEHMFDLIHADI